MQAFLCCIILTTGVITASEIGSEVNNEELKMSRRFIVGDGGLSATQQSQIKQGFDAAKHIAEKLDKLDFGGVAGALIGAMSSYLGALGPFVGLALSFFGGESAQMKLLKQLFTDVENRFDQVDVQFAQLRRQVAFVPTQVHFTDLESNINAVHTALKTLSKVTNAAGYRYEKNEFKHTYDRTYESAGVKLFQGIVHGGLTTGGIFHEFMVYASYDRRETQRFMLGTLNLLMRAAALEITYSQLSNDPNIAVKRKDWESRFSQVKSKMLSIDHETVRNYHNQMVQDVNDFGTQHPKGTLSNADFSNQLYTKLTQKYFWRDWLLIIAPTHGSDKFINHACELNQHDNHGRSIVVASVDKSHKPISTSAASNILHPLTLYRSFVGHGDLKRHYVCVNSNDAYSHLPDSARNHCSPYAAAGVMCAHNTDIHIHAASGRYKSYTPHSTANRAYLFG